VEELARIDKNIDLALTTNGVLLAKYADELKSAGLSRINISLDTLNRKKFQQISRFDLFDKVMNGIEHALRVGFDPIKINVVVVRGVNDDEILDFIEITKEKPLWVRFIELMPFGRNNWSDENFISADEIKEHIETRYQLVPISRFDASSVAVDYKVDGYKGVIGFIAPLSRKFCDFCNRLRLTADGRLLPCLHSDMEINIKAPMRAGASDDELKLILREAMLAKPKEHTLCDENTVRTSRNMSKVGG
jgi:cyclic pyranopterin phosphate synthase